MKKLILLLLLGSCKSEDLAPSVCYERTYVRETSHVSNKWIPEFVKDSFVECGDYESLMIKYNYSQSGERTRISQKTNCIKK